MGQEAEERAAQNAAPQQAEASAQNTASQGSEQKPAQEKSLVRITSPEQVDDYIRVTTPSMWLLVSAILVLLAAGIIWAYSVKLEVKTTKPDGTVTTEYVKPASFLTDGTSSN